MEFKPYKSIGFAEQLAIEEVVRSGVLSGFISGPAENRNAHPNGGPKVRELEELWADKYGVKHAISFNSATSGLLAACVALDVGPRRDLLCPAWTMSASAAVGKFLGAEVVFSDIDPETYCIDPEDCLTLRPVLHVVGDVAMAVHLFGHPAPVRRLKEYGVSVIEDCAQAPWAYDNGKIAGTIGDIGVYSLNRHKHIHCGEGGVAVTNDDELADMMRAVRNHGIDPVGLNLRMGEMEAAVACVQLKDFAHHLARRVDLAGALSDGLRDVMDIPKVREGCTHNYYLWTTKGSLEGVPHIKGYIEPLHKTFQTGESLPVVEAMREQVSCFEICKWDIEDPTELIETIKKAN